MKKLTIAFLLCFTLIFSACSNDEKTETSNSSSKVDAKVSKTEESKKKKVTEEKKLAEESEKKRQEEISKKVSEADEAMKTAEASPTDETVDAAKKSVDAIPGGNNDLRKRLEVVTAKLNEIKQQAAAQQANQTQQQNQQQMTNPDPDFIDADGNGFDDRSVFNDSAARAEYARGEAEAQRQWEQQNDAAAQLDQYRDNFKAQNGREPTSGEIQSQWLKEQGLE